MRLAHAFDFDPVLARFGKLARVGCEFDPGARLVQPLEHRFVVDLVAVGHRDEPSAAVEAHDVGLVVVGPVADVFAAFRRQEVEGVPGLLQARAQPADRPRTGGVRNGRQRAPNDRLFLPRRRFVEAAGVAFAVTHPLPAALSTFVDDLGMIGAEVAVERDGGADAVAIERFHQAKDADPIAIVARRP